MSDMKKARLVLADLLQRNNYIAALCDKQETDLKVLARLITREPPVRRARRGPPIVITDELAADVIEMAESNPNMTLHEIANRTGLRSVGRPSEILTGKR